MVSVYARIRERARQIVSRFPQPRFYSDHSREFELAKHIFDTDQILRQLKTYLADKLDDDFGHGMPHATKVALDAGVLMAVEGREAGSTTRSIGRGIIIVQCAGLLHDVKRKHDDHGVKGATYAHQLLSAYPLSSDEVEAIRIAIHNHEAFKDCIQAPTQLGALVSDCLYDADKFRWGPDNFSDTLWGMVSFKNPPLEDFVAYYPRGIESLLKIKSTFRTRTGKKYGPEFIDMGVEIGEALLKVIKSEFQ